MFAGCLKEDGIDAMVAMEGRFFGRTDLLSQWGRSLGVSSVPLPCATAFMVLMIEVGFDEA